MNKVKVVSPEGEETEMIEEAFINYWGPERGWKLASESAPAAPVSGVVPGSTGTGESTQTVSTPLTAGTETTT